MSSTDRNEDINNAPRKGAASTGSEQPHEGGDDKRTRPKPKRPLSAYNFYFHSERQNILQDTPTRKEGKPRRSHGKIGFADLARSIAAKWKCISKEERATFDKKAAADKERYQREMAAWKKGSMVVAAAAPVKPVQMHQNIGNYTSILTDSVNQSFLREQTSFWRETPDHQTLDYLVACDQKLPGEDIAIEPYYLTEVYGSHFEQLLQPLPLPYYQARVNQQNTSPKIADLASKLDDEATQFFLSLFPPEG